MGTEADALKDKFLQVPPSNSKLNPLRLSDETSEDPNHLSFTIESDNSRLEERATVAFHNKAKETRETEAQKYRNISIFKISVPGTLHPQPYMKSNYELDEQTRLKLDRQEQWHFCILQLGWFTIVVFLTSLFELLIFAIGYFGTDHDPRPD